MARPSYRAAVDWIALNDDSNLGGPRSGWLTSICLVADLFGKEQDDVGNAVMRARGRHEREQRRAAA